MKIAICGPAAAGKGTIGRVLAQREGIAYVDAGLLFRMAVYAREQGYIKCIRDLIGNPALRPFEYRWDGERARVMLSGQDITVQLSDPAIARRTAEMASDTATFTVLIAAANAVIRQWPDVVVDGRNAGTILVPDAKFKFYVTASLPVRTRRRLKDFRSLGYPITHREVMRDLAARDRMDRERVIGPLIVPPDAVVINTDTLSVAEAVAFTQKIIHGRGI